MNLRDLPARWKERWQNFTQAQKIAAVLISVSIAVCLFYLTSFLVRPNYAPLFKHLEVQEAGKIAETLKAQNIDYRITDQGRTIEVPEEKVYDLRMQLASEGILPGSGQGFELFDQTKLAQTDFEQQVVYQRALQEELRRSITALDAVEEARVHLVLPTKSVFIEEEGTASASVVLKLKPLSKLTPSQVRGINDLLIGSVEGLSPENIHIIDTRGNVLNDFLKNGSDPEQMANSAVEQQQLLRENIQRSYEKRLKQFLTPVYGPGKTVAMVSVELDFSKAKTTRTEVLAGQLVSEQTESSSGSSAGSAGAAGTTSQLPGSDYPFMGGSSGEYSQEKEIKNYENGKEVTVIEQPPGAIKRVTTSVIVDSSVETVDREAIQRIVAAAIGYQPERGDEIIVQTMPFDTSAQDALDAQEAELQKQQEQKRLYTLIGIGAALLILLIIGLRFFISRRRRAKMAEPEPVVPVPVGDIEEQAQQEVAAADAADRTKDLKEMAKQNPSDVAQIIKLWLKE
ncbi:flagellar M-ring protein FliF [Desulfohalotomaculum tongense]|uniref:flagellar basal-body MS-ring/collar protein FliF n=1 Tax=Desulforadius tongensis TaxID=1216062 RepID=UPI00195A6C87|nr:flagellar basal-body MS-ring/collar protein FliF [Desulforadius tongensis]MBM7854209.1 flagellar M-ring protein FliF [Desulforadius tongensis]